MAYGLSQKNGTFFVCATSHKLFAISSCFIVSATGHKSSAIRSGLTSYAISHTPYALRFRDAVGGWRGQTTWAIRGAAPHARYEGDATDLVDQSHWTVRSTTNAAQDGSQIHIASLARTRTPYSLKNSPMPIGDTRTGRTGKKYLVVSNGEKKATPNPPFVIASSTPCEAVQRKK